MRFCLFIESEINGGLNTFIKNFLHNTKDQVEIICNKNFYLDDEIKKKTKIFRYHFQEDNQKFLKYISFAKKISKFVNILRYVKSDKFLVINGGHPGCFNAILSIIAWRLQKKNKRIVYNFHNLAAKSNYKNFVIHLFSNIIISICIQKIVTVSKAALNSINHIYLLKNIKKKIIFNGTVDLQKTLNYKTKKNKNYFLILASYEKRKGIHIAMESFNKFCNYNQSYNLHIYGDKKGGYFREIKKQWLGLEYRSKIKLNPYFKNKAELINNCEALIMPSIGFESFGYTLIEAMSLGKIVMASDIGGMPEVIKSGYNGFIYKSNNSLILKKLLLSFVKEQKTIKNNLKKNARKTFLKKFKSTDMSKKYLELIKKI